MKTGTSFASRRGDDRDRDARDKDMKERSDSSPWDRRDNGRSERSSDWRRCEDFFTGFLERLTLGIAHQRMP